ncbi:MAG: prolyl oligopeptidase family serine peptidase [Candidatus Poribacteria bacterium]|nr:prolyl oligopeptidase family serine peptidase [Candidatus Poribacteria bacterium]
MKHTDILESINDILCLELLSNSHSIAVSPDGRQLAVIVQNYRRHQARRISERFLPSGLNQGFEGSEIWLVTVKNGESRNLTPNWGTSYRPAWSPDGEKLAFYSDKHGKAQLWAWERGENEPRLASEVTIRPFSQSGPPPLWTPDGTRIVVKLQPETEVSEETLPDREAESVTVFASCVPEETPINKENPEGESELWWPSWGHWFRSDVGVITVATGEVQTLARGFHPFGLRLSPDGTTVGIVNFRGFETLENAQGVNEFYLFPLDGTPPKLIADSLKFHGLLFSWSPDGRYIAYTTEGYPLSTEASKSELFLISTTDGSQVNLTQRTDIELANSSHPPLWSSDSRYLFCVAQGHLWRVEVASRAIEKLTDGFDRRVVRLVRQAETDTVWSPDNTESVSVQTLRGTAHGFHRINLKTRKITRLVEETRVYNRKGNMDVAPQTGDIFYSVEDISHPSEMWIADADFQNPRQLTRLNSGIEKAPLGTSQNITWQTPVGKQLRGALLFPADYVEGQSYPLITQVYGGSFLSYRGNDFGTDGTGHNFLLTKQGYVVFLPDMPMQTNAPIQELTECVLSGIDAVVDMGIADAKRLGVMGHSYGGYCVNALITRTSRFAAAVSSAPISDLISFYGYLTEGGDSPWITWAERSQGKMGGSLWEFRERYIENSPIFFLDKVETPLLLIVGALDDTAVPQAGEMFSGLRRLGKKAVLVRYEDEGHVPQKGRYPNVIDYWQRVLTWFDEHLSESPEGDPELQREQQ